MRKIKLTGREAAVVRAIGFGMPLPGSDLVEVTRIEPEDLTDVLNGLLTVGFIECTPYTEQVTLEVLPTTEFEANTAYTHELKAALGISRRR
ncbi:MAG: hypothetical protein JO295_04820 [Verrucomicrobia bacterium]|nr:hypothetical protein [Verrucomicrobiota bacterium]